MSLRPSGCGACGAPLHDDQRYCLECGARHGAPRVDALSELGFAAAPAAPAPAAVAAIGAQKPVPIGRAMPSRRLTAALAAATLALGGVAGAAVGPAPEGSDAAAVAPARVVALVVPQAPVAAANDEDDADARPPEDEGSSETPSGEDAEASDDTAAASGDDAGSGDATTDDAGEDATDDSASAGDEDDDASSPTAATPGASSTTPSSTGTAGTAPAHVWLVSLPAADAATAFGAPSPLAALVPQGAYLPNYTAAGPSPASNQLALLGGVVPTADCAANLAACVLPAGETSLLDQLTAIQLTWRAYVEDPAARCAPAPGARVGSSLFTTVTQRGDCATTTVAPERLAADLKAIDKTPALSLVVPDTSERAKAIADQVLASEAYKKDGVLVLAPDAPSPTAPAAPTGALVLSPSATAGSTLDAATGPLALLRSVDALFGLDPLGAAAQAAAGALDPIFPPTTINNTTRRSP